MSRSGCQWAHGGLGGQAGGWNRPSRDAGLFTAGVVALDNSSASAVAAGQSSAVAKNIVTLGTPVNNYGSAGQVFVVVNASSTDPSRSAGARALTGGLATAGARAVATQQASAQTTGAVIGVFNAGNRNGAASQNGAFIQATGTQSATYIQVSSLGAVSPGDPRVTPQGQATGGSGGSQTLPTPGTGTGGSLGPAPAVVGPSLGLRSGSAGQGVEAGDSTARAPAQQGGVGVTPADGLPYELKPGHVLQEYYYGPPAKEEPVQRNAGGGVAQAWLQHQDVVGQPQQRAATTSNTGATVNTFGAANTFGMHCGRALNTLPSCPGSLGMVTQSVLRQLPGPALV
ncbi:hypothetical protein V8C86DRAFT_2430617 [Haematococcus lacustris]